MRNGGLARDGWVADRWVGEGWVGEDVWVRWVVRMGG